MNRKIIVVSALVAVAGALAVGITAGADPTPNPPPFTFDGVAQLVAGCDLTVYANERVVVQVAVNGAPAVGYEVTPGSPLVVKNPTPGKDAWWNADVAADDGWGTQQAGLMPGSCPP